MVQTVYLILIVPIRNVKLRQSLFGLEQVAVVFVSPWCHKIRLSYCRRKVSVNRYLPVQQMAKPAPFPRQPEAKV